MPNNSIFDALFGSPKALQNNSKRLKQSTMTSTLRKVAFGAFLSLSALTAVTLTSCNKDDDSCPTGYEGSDCKTLISAKFVGAYEGNETCTIGTDAYTVTLTSVSANNMKLTLANLYNNASTLDCNITETNKFNISGTFGTGTYTGSGTLNGNDLTIKYTFSDGVTSNSCEFIGTKK